MTRNLERLKLLEQYAQEDPNDPFPIYALALEWVNFNPQKAEDLFNKLLKDHADYLPVYYHAGQFFLAAGDKTKAMHILETGIRKTKATGDLKALAELRSLYDDSENESDA